VEAGVPLASKRRLRTRALHRRQGIPEDADTRVKIASGIVDDLVKAGKKIDDIAIDPSRTPLSVNSNYGMVLMDTSGC